MQSGDSIMTQSFPQFDQSHVDHQAQQDLEWVKQFIVAVRNIRGEMDIAPSKALPVLIKNISTEDKRRLTENTQFLSALAKLESIDLLTEGDEEPASASALVGELTLLIPMAGLIDKIAELARLNKAIDKLTTEANRIQGKLANENFVSKAPDVVINKERAKLSDAQFALSKLLEQKNQIAAL
jgi:valyl-tRNA synthetase